MANETNVKKGIITPVVKLEERTTPVVDAGKGQVYVKSSDNKLWFVDSLGADREVGLDNDAYDYYVLNNLATDHLNWLDLKGALENPAYNSVFINDGTYYAEDDASAGDRAINNYLSLGQKIIGNSINSVVIDCTNLTSATLKAIQAHPKTSIKNITIQNFQINTTTDHKIISGGKYHSNIILGFSFNPGTGGMSGFHNCLYSSNLNSSINNGGLSFDNCKNITNSTSESGIISNCSFFSNCRFEEDGEQVNLLEHCNNFTNCSIWASETATVFLDCHHMKNTDFDSIYVTETVDAFVDCTYLDGINIPSCTFDSSTNYLFNNCEHIDNVIVDGSNSTNGITNCNKLSNIKLSNFKGCPIRYSNDIQNIELIGNWSGLTANTSEGHLHRCDNVSGIKITGATSSYYANGIVGQYSDITYGKYFNVDIESTLTNPIGIGVNYAFSVLNSRIHGTMKNAFNSCSIIDNADVLGCFNGLTANTNEGHIQKCNSVSNTIIRPAVNASGYYANGIVETIVGGTKTSNYENIRIEADPDNDKRFGIGAFFINGIDNIIITGCTLNAIKNCNNVNGGTFASNFNELIANTTEGHIQECDNVSNTTITPAVSTSGYYANAVVGNSTTHNKGYQNIKIETDINSYRRFGIGVQYIDNIDNIKITKCSLNAIKNCNNVNGGEFIGNFNELIANTTEGHIQECDNVSNTTITPAINASGYYANAIIGIGISHNKGYQNIKIEADPDNDKRFSVGIKYIDNIEDIEIIKCSLSAMEYCKNVDGGVFTGNYNGLTTYISGGHIHECDNVSNTTITPAVSTSGFFSYAIVGNSTTHNKGYQNIKIEADPDNDKRFGVGIKYIDNIEDIEIIKCSLNAIKNCNNVNGGVFTENYNGLLAINTTEGHIHECDNISNATITPAVSTSGYYANAIVGNPTTHNKGYQNIKIEADPDNDKRFGIGMQYIDNYSNIYIYKCQNEALNNCNNGSNIELEGNVFTLPSSKTELGHVNYCNKIDGLSITPSIQSGITPIGKTKTIYDFESNSGTGTNAWGADWTLSSTGSFAVTDFTISSTGTSSQDTGPTGNALTGRGNFLYAEASNNTGSGTAEYSGTSWGKLLSLSFYYHMYAGVTPAEISQMGDLVVYFKDSGNSWIEVWRQSGRRQTSSEQPFEKVTIDMRKHDARGIKIAFENIQSFHSDICIDDIVFETASYITAGVSGSKDISNLSIIANPLTDAFIGDGVYNSKNIQGYIEGCTYDGISFTDGINDTNIRKCSVGINTCSNVNNLSIDECANEGILSSKNINILNLKNCKIGINDSENINDISYEDMKGIVFYNSKNISNVKGDDFTNTVPAILFESCLNINNVEVNINMETGKWVASTDYSSNDGVNQWVIPTAGLGSYIYKNIGISGVSGSSEPTWPTTEGATVVDGSVTWKAYKYDGINGQGILFYACFIINNITITSENSNTTMESLLTVFYYSSDINNFAIRYLNALITPIIFSYCNNINETSISISAMENTGIGDSEIILHSKNISNISLNITYLISLLNKTIVLFKSSEIISNIKAIISFSGITTTNQDYIVFDNCENLSNLNIKVSDLILTGTGTIAILNDTSRVNTGILEYDTITSSATTASKMITGICQNFRGLEAKGTNITNTTYGFYGGNQVIGCYGVDNGDFDVASSFFANSGYNDFT